MKIYSLLLFFLVIYSSVTIAQTYFGDQNLITGQTNSANSVFACDIDDDGDMDEGEFGEQRIISTVADGASCVYACDIDGDGDMDVISASCSDDKVAWYENTDGEGDFGAQQIVTTSANYVVSVYACDLDGDGDNDIVFASYVDDEIAWCENTDGYGNFSLKQIITTDTDGANSVYACDIDGDGDADVLSSSEFDDKIAWYENIDGNGTFGAQQIITIAANGAQSVYACDIDGDGDNDVISASFYDNKIAWYENTDGDGSFATQQIITISDNSLKSVYACDIDGDGDNDVLSASSYAENDGEISWYENEDGNGGFGDEQVITTLAYLAKFVYACDIDNDGDIDVLSASESDGKIALYKNIDGEGTFGSQQLITISVLGASSVYACDIDGDGDNDVVSSSSLDDKICWYENTDGNGLFRFKQTVTNNADQVVSVYASDIDGDGDIDLLSASILDDKVAWYENTDGNGNFSSEQIITSSTERAKCVYACDIDGDGDNDVITCSTSFYDNKISWYENTDGNGLFGPQQIITDLADSPTSVYACDIDGDGDIDVISASFYDNKVAWYENIDGYGNFSTEQIITNTAGGATRVYACDIDGDSDNDVLAASSSDNKITWYENIDGNGNFSSEKIITTSVDGPKTVYACDIDSDGDNDVFYGSYDSNILWSENINGNGDFGPQQIITDLANSPNSVYACDIDGDADLDLLSASYSDNKICWYENHSLVITSEPENTAVCPNSNATFTINIVGADSCQWQVDEGAGFYNLVENTEYIGTASNTLQIVNVSINMSGYQYRCNIINSDGSITSSIVILTVDNIIHDIEYLSTLSGECISVVNNSPTATSCITASVITATTNDPLEYTEQGTYTIAWAYDDGNGNISEQIQTVIVDDNTAPIADVVVLPDVTGECSVILSEIPTATDNCSGLITATGPDDLTILESQSITWIFDDGYGNSSIQTQYVSINDINDPVISCNEDHIIELDEGEEYYTVLGAEFDPVSTEDNCGVSSIINDLNSLSTLEGIELAPGTTTIV